VTNAGNGPGSLAARLVAGARAVVVPVTRAWLDRAVARAQSRALRRTRAVAVPAGAARPPVRFLLLHAWGVGGTIRTTFTTAAYLSSTHDVEVVSILRGAVEPGLAVPAGVRLRALHDRTRRRPTPRNGMALLLAKVPSVLWHEQDWAYQRASLWTDVLLLRWLRSLPNGTIVVTTRPALTLLASRLAPAGVVVIAQEHQHLSHHRQKLREALAAALPNVSTLLTLTQSDRAAYQELLGATGPPVHAIPNAVPDVPGGPGDPGAHRLMAAGRLNHQKGFDLLLAAFAAVAPSHPDWFLDIFGEGPLRPKLEQQVIALRLSAQARINPSTPRLGERMRDASVQVLSSRFEGFPLILLEAMAAGLCVVSFDCPTGPGEIITDESNGLLVPARDVTAMAAALSRVMSDESLRRRLAAAAPAAMRPYSSQQVGRRWDELLSETTPGMSTDNRDRAPTTTVATSRLREGEA
jgi:glycosyltransferase involved in cell wall biosynthesis